MTKTDSGERLIASNKKAYHDYHVLQKLEAGIELTGTEVKSLRDGKANLKDSYVGFEHGEAYLLSAHISPYSHGGYANHDPLRPRKLLLHRQEILKLTQKTRAGGQTLVPLRLYLSKGRVKVEIALAKGKKLWDKREAIKEKDQQKEARAAIRERRRS